MAIDCVSAHLELKINEEELKIPQIAGTEINK